MSKFDIGKITIQSGDEIGYTFKFPIASSATANDGAIPYGRTISSVIVTAYDEDDADVTSELIEGTPSLSTVTVTVVLKYPASGVGRYKLTFDLTLDNGWTREVDFTTLYCKEI